MKRLLAILSMISFPHMALADNLYHPGQFAALASDRVARQVGDSLTVIVYEQTETSNSVKTDSKRSTQLSGTVTAGHVSEAGNVQFGGGYSGGGAVQRADKVVAQISVEVTQVLPNGDLMISGQQQMRVNGERTLIGLEGRIRPADITADNRVLSSRIANARIVLDGRGFVARSAKPGLVAKLFRILGLG